MNKYLTNFIEGFIFQTIFFTLYVQFSPNMGNVWIRGGKFVPMNLINLMLHPFKIGDFWSLYTIDVNWFLSSIIIGISWTCYQNLH